MNLPCKISLLYNKGSWLLRSCTRFAAASASSCCAAAANVWLSSSNSHTVHAADRIGRLGSAGLAWWEVTRKTCFSRLVQRTVQEPLRCRSVAGFRQLFLDVTMLEFEYDPKSFRHAGLSASHTQSCSFFSRQCLFHQLAFQKAMPWLL